MVLGMNALPFTSRARAVLEEALNEAASHRSEYVGVEHMLLALSAPGSRAAVTAHPSLSAACSAVREAVARAAVRGSGDGRRSLPQTPAARESIIAAMSQAASLKHRVVNSEHLFLGILELRAEPFVDLLSSDGSIDIEFLHNELAAASQHDQRIDP